MLFRGECKVNRIDVVKTVNFDCSKWSSVDMNLRKIIVSSMSLLVLPQLQLVCLLSALVSICGSSTAFV